MSLSRRPVCAAAVVALSAVGALSAAAGAASAAPAAPTVTRTVAVSADAFVDAAAPHRRTGDLDKLVASDTPRTEKATYLKFAVPAAPAGHALSKAELVLSAERSTGHEVRLHGVGSGWDESSLTFAAKPALGPVRGTARVTAAGEVTLGVTGLVSSGTTQSFALSSNDGVTAFRAKEAGRGAARLVVTWTAKGGPGTPGPGTPGPGTPGPGTPGPGTPKGGMRFGVSIPYEKDERIGDTVARYRQQFGALPAVRIFGNNIPTTWDSEPVLKALGSSSSVIFSFKGDMTAIASGSVDARLTRFLSTKPAGVKVWVALHHEPEDDVERGRFTPAQFRAATAHVAPVIRQAGGIPTTILMAYTLSKGSGRDWHDYYTPQIDVLAWDAYNSAQKKETQSYKAPEKFIEPVLAAAKETGKAFGWAEFGSPCIDTDPTCVQRAAWLTAVGKAAEAAGGEFLTYWNRPALDGDLDFSLSDKHSVNAWRNLIAD